VCRVCTLDSCQQSLKHVTNPWLHRLEKWLLHHNDLCIILRPSESRNKTLCLRRNLQVDMGWLRLSGSSKSYVSFAKEPCKRDDILQKKPIIWRSLPIEATP